MVIWDEKSDCKYRIKIGSGAVCYPYKKVAVTLLGPNKASKKWVLRNSLDISQIRDLRNF